MGSITGISSFKVVKLTRPLLSGRWLGQADWFPAVSRGYRVRVYSSSVSRPLGTDWAALALYESAECCRYICHILLFCIIRDASSLRLLRLPPGSVHPSLHLRGGICICHCRILVGNARCNVHAGRLGISGIFRTPAYHVTLLHGNGFFREIPL